MLIHIDYYNRLEAEALSFYLKKRGYKVDMRPGFSPSANGQKNVATPRVLLLDLDLLEHRNNPEWSRAMESDCQVIMMGSLAQLHYYLEAADTSLYFACKQLSAGEFLAIFNYLETGGRYVCKKIRDFVEDAPYRRQQRLLGDNLEKPLSDMELRIMAEIAEGVTTKAIARTIFRSVHTINNHRKNAMDKLGINGTFALNVYAVDRKHEIKTLAALVEDSTFRSAGTDEE